nr:MFS transporter [uncultured Pseudogulbenkiania sp.]
MNQVISHGFGLFLFAAMVPLMRESIAISHWHLALAGALTQIAYLGGAMLLGLVGHRLKTATLALVTGTVSTLMLFTMSQLQNPLVMIVALVCLATSAAMSWGSIVEIVSRCALPHKRSTYLSCVSSGTAWGYALSGQLLLWVVPAWGWESGWIVAGLMGTLVVGLTWRMLRGLKAPVSDSTDSGVAAIPVSRLLSIILTERTALLACLICFLVGFSTMPFSNWLNIYLEELGLPASLGGYCWSIVGFTGMVAGFLLGKLADRKGHASALLIIFVCFAFGLLAFAYDPANTALIASFGYGLMYFPMWGIVAGWVNRHYSSTATMQIGGFCMVTFGLGGTLGNLLTGLIRDNTGSLQGSYATMAFVALLLTGLGVHIKRAEKKHRPDVSVPEAVKEVNLP